MKYLILKLLLLLIIFNSYSYAGPMSVHFEQPFILSGEASVKAERVKKRLDQNENRWKVRSTKHRSVVCRYSLKIQGRDIALENDLIGEHLFGELDFDCDGRGLLFKPFKTHFSRVLVTGIRNCVKSETIVDNDYCNLVVLAFQKETDRSRENGDIYRRSSRRRTDFRINSTRAKEIVEKHTLVPNGMNRRLLSAYQVFNLNAGKEGMDFFINDEGRFSSFSQGVNHFLTSDENTLRRDEETRDRVNDQLDLISRLLREVSSAQNPQDEFQEKISTVLSNLSSAVRSSLSVMSPIEYFNLEKRIEIMKNRIVESASSYDPNVSDQNSFEINYVNDFRELKKILSYVNNSHTSNIVEVIQDLGTGNRTSSRTPRFISNSEFEDLFSRVSRFTDGEILLDFLQTYFNRNLVTFDQFKRLFNAANYLLYANAEAQLIGAYYFSHRLELVDEDITWIIRKIDSSYHLPSQILRRIREDHSRLLAEGKI